MAIYQSAERDIRHRHYTVALEKLSWLYDHSLEVDPAFRGVRNSFMLGTWHDLGTRYTPAMAGLQAELEQAAAALRGTQDDCNCERRFGDVVAISRVLKEQSQLRDSFLWLDANRSKVAAAACMRHLPELAAAEAAWPCGKYVDATRLMGDYVGEYHEVLLSVSGHPLEKRIMERVSREAFSYQAAVLVALLAHGGRQAEADAVTDQALQELGQAGELPSGLLAQARKGQMPAPPPDF